MKRSFTVRYLTEKSAKSSLRQSFPKVNTEPDMHAHALSHTLQYSAEGSGTSRRQHPVPTEWLLCHKGQFSFSLAQLPAWDLNASLTDLWPQVFVFCFLGTSRPSSLSSFLVPSLFSFSSSQVVCRGCPGNLAGFPADCPPECYHYHHHTHIHPHPFKMDC